MATPPSQGKLLYHITHIDNMESILRTGLVPRGRNSTSFKDIADQVIINKRRELSEDLTRYVPFHFFVLNPFDGAVCRQYGAENMAIISIPRPKKEEEERFRIIPSHPLGNDEPEILPYEAGMRTIKWDILDLREGRDYHDQTIKNACLAECVALDKIPPEQFFKVFASTDAAAERLRCLASRCGVEVSWAPHMSPWPPADCR